MTEETITKEKPKRQRKTTALASAHRELTDEQIALLKRTVAKGCSDDEFALFMYIAKKHKLDPFTRQIHMIKRFVAKHHQNEKGIWEPGEIAVVMTGIDGYRVCAARDKMYAGQDEPEYEMAPDGKLPLLAKVRVYRKDFERPTVAVAYWSEYAPYDLNKPEAFMWRKMPHLMIGKCAEALALRKAFPDLADIYVDEEMDHINDELPTGRVVRAEPKVLESPQSAAEGAATNHSPVAAPATQNKTLVISWTPAKDYVHLAGNLAPWLDFIQTDLHATWDDKEKAWRIRDVFVQGLYEEARDKAGWTITEFVREVEQPVSAPSASRPMAPPPAQAVPPDFPTSGKVTRVVSSPASKVIGGKKTTESRQVCLCGVWYHVYAKHLWAALEKATDKQCEFVVEQRRPPVITGIRKIGDTLYDDQGIAMKDQNEFRQSLF